jgi:hypothetical protein
MSTRFHALLALLLGLAGVVVPASGASAAVGGRPIAPGVRMVTGGTVCTAGAVLRDDRGRTLVAYAARCAAGRAVGARVRFTTERGRTVARGRLAHVDGALALVRVSARRTTATMPAWGGPSGLAALPAAGARVFTVGRTTDALAPRSELLGAGSRLAPALPFRASDSGALVLDDRGRAVGLVGSVSGEQVSVIGLAAAVAAARSHGFPGLALVRGGAFSPSAVA